MKTGWFLERPGVSVDRRAQPERREVADMRLDYTRAGHEEEVVRHA
jgi:hypothetical protein